MHFYTTSGLLKGNSSGNLASAFGFSKEDSKSTSSFSSYHQLRKTPFDLKPLFRSVISSVQFCRFQHLELFRGRVKLLHNAAGTTEAQKRKLLSPD